MQVADALGLRSGSRRAFVVALLLLHAGEGVEVSGDLQVVRAVSGAINLDRASQRGRSRRQVGLPRLRLTRWCPRL